MKNNEIENRINQSFSKITPNVIDSVLADSENGKQIIMVEEKKIINKPILALAMTFVLMFVGVFAIQNYKTNYAVASVVALDVNPSIEIKVNEKEVVLDVEAKNEDAEIVIGEMDFKGNNLDVTVNALIGSMLRNGYINELANSILISVDSKNTDKAVVIQEKLTEEVTTLLKTDTFEGSVMSQNISSNNELQELANKYNITVGKVQLINKIIEKKPQYTFDELVPLSINELNLLLNSQGTSLDDVTSTGTASDKKYIGEEEAKRIAFKHAKISENLIDEVDMSIDYEDESLVYEIEFILNDIKYSYSINAVNGKLEKFESKEIIKEDINEAIITEKNYLTKEEIIKLISTHLCTHHDNLTSLNMHLGHCSDISADVYDVEFMVENTKYSYRINATTGEILCADSKIRGEIHHDEGNHHKYIDKQQIISIMCEHFKLDSISLPSLKVNRGNNEKANLYEIECIIGNTRYMLSMDAITGEILEGSSEVLDVNSDNNGNKVTFDEKAILNKLLTELNITEDMIKSLKIKPKYQNKELIFVVDFEYNEQKYCYHINAMTGEITIIKSNNDQPVVTTKSNVNQGNNNIHHTEKHNESNHHSNNKKN